MSVEFTDSEVISQLPNHSKLKQFLQNQVSIYNRNIGSLNYVFMNDENLLYINKEFLNHDYYTDIISFDLGEKGQKAIEADIYISVDRVADNASEYGVEYEEELHRVIFHGLLHLLGFKDKNIEDQNIMREKEDEWLQKYSQFKLES